MHDALLRVIESWRKCLDASGIVGDSVNGSF